MRDELSILKENDVDYECLLDSLLFAFQNHVDSVSRTMETNTEIVKVLTNSGILV